MRVLTLIIISFCFSGCFSSICSEKTYNEQLLHDLQYILSKEDKNELKYIAKTDSQAAAYIEQFWSSLDPDTTTEENEYRVMYEQRVQYAKVHFATSCGWGNSDRARVFMIYGPPATVEIFPWTEDYLANGMSLKSYEVWVYNETSDITDIPHRFEQIFPNMQKFIFADKSGVGIYDLIFSTVQDEHRDPYSLWLD
ncbi:MAG: GWxTD domain-containing protein [Calditrichota bacterium]